MKKIAIFGALWTPNFGDVLLAKMFKDEFLKYGCDVKFPNASEAVKRKLDSRGSFYDLLAADTVVFCGGGYFSEPPGLRAKWAFSRYKRLFWVATFCRVFRKPYWVLGVGAGPLKSRVSRWMVKHVCRGAKLVAVRDHESRRVVSEVSGSSNVLLVADYVLTMKERKAPVCSNPPKLGLHITINAKATIPVLLDYMVRFGGNYDLYFIEDHSGEYEKVRSVFPRVREMFGANVIKYKNDTNGFIDQIDRLDYIITNKLHVGILSCVLKKHVCSFPYHDKVERFYEEIGRKELFLKWDGDKDKAFAHLDQFLVSSRVTIPGELIERALMINEIIKSISHTGTENSEF